MFSSLSAARRSLSSLFRSESRFVSLSSVIPSSSRFAAPPLFGVNGAYAWPRKPGCPGSAQKLPFIFGDRLTYGGIPAVDGPWILATVEPNDGQPPGGCCAIGQPVRH
jgi:hypothetical protein